MNKIEKIVYDCVKSNPKIKFLLRNAYQMAFDMLPTPKNEFSGDIDTANGYFFGFHDKSPFSADETKLLAHKTTIPVRMPKADEPCGIGYFDFSPENGSRGMYHELAKSYGWNYHKGCRLQWRCQTIMFNSIDGNNAVAIEIDTNGNVMHRYPYAIDTISNDGHYATSFSYERLNILMPGYGYEYCQDGGYLDENAPEGTGLFLADLQTGERKLLFSLKELAESVGEQDIMSYKHYVTHTEFSHDGRYISFLHRWIGEDYRKRNSRLMVWDSITNKLHTMPTTGMVSHYIWNHKYQIIAYCSVKEGDAHVLFDMANGSYTPILLGKLNMDGHQSMLTDNIFITDTYPDRRRMASLFCVDAARQTMQRIAYVYSPKKFQTKDFHCHIACDLHPRVSPSGKYVCFDSAYTGERGLSVMKLEKQ